MRYTHRKGPPRVPIMAALVIIPVKDFDFKVPVAFESGVALAFFISGHEKGVINIVSDFF
jgi:hypothetical protein